MNILKVLEIVEELYNIFDIPQTIILSETCKDLNNTVKNKSIKYKIIMRNEKLLDRLISLCDIEYIFTPEEFKLCLDCFINSKRMNPIHDISNCVVPEGVIGLEGLKYLIGNVVGYEEVDFCDIQSIGKFVDYIISCKYCDKYNILSYFDIFYDIMSKIDRNYSTPITLACYYIVIESIKLLYHDVEKLIKFISKFGINIRYRFSYHEQNQELVTWINQISNDDKFKLFRHTFCTNLWLCENIINLFDQLSSSVQDSENFGIEAIKYIICIAINDYNINTVLNNDLREIIDILSNMNQLIFNYKRRINGEISKEEYIQYINKTIYYDE